MKIGYMPTRGWGCPTTAMWTYRLGPARAKQPMFTATRGWGCPTTAMWTYRLGLARAKQPMFTGDTIDGAKAAE